MAKKQPIDIDPVEAEQRLRESCRQQFIEEKKMVRVDDGEIRLTAKGKESVLRELERYRLRPGMVVLLEQYFAEHFGISVY